MVAGRADCHPDSDTATRPRQRLRCAGCGGGPSGLSAADHIHAGLGPGAAGPGRGGRPSTRPGRQPPAPSGCRLRQPIARRDRGAHRRVGVARQSSRQPRRTRHIRRSREAFTDAADVAELAHQPSVAGGQPSRAATAAPVAQSALVAVVWDFRSGGGREESACAWARGGVNGDDIVVCWLAAGMLRWMSESLGMRWLVLGAMASTGSC